MVFSQNRVVDGQQVVVHLVDEKCRRHKPLAELLVTVLRRSVVLRIGPHTAAVVPPPCFLNHRRSDDHCSAIATGAVPNPAAVGARRIV